MKEFLSFLVIGGMVYILITLTLYAMSGGF